MKTRLITLLALAVMTQKVVGGFLGINVETYDKGNVEFSHYLSLFRESGPNGRTVFYNVYEISGSNISSITIPKFWRTNDILKIDTGRGLFDDEIEFDKTYRTNRTRISFDKEFVGFLCIDGSSSRHLNVLGREIRSDGLCDEGYYFERLRRKDIVHHYEDKRYYLWRHGVDMEIVYDDYKIYSDRLWGNYLVHIIEITSSNRFINISEDTPISSRNSNYSKVFAPLEMFPFFIRKSSKQLIALGGEGLELEVSGNIVDGKWHKINWTVYMYNGLSMAHTIFDPKGASQRTAFYRIRKEPTLGDIPSVVIDE